MARQYEFGPFRLDSAGPLLSRKGQVVQLPPKVADVLRVLVESSGRVVEKDDLLKRVWPGTFVEEGSLARTISVLRKALDDGTEGPEYIATVPKRGYRFAAPVTVARDELMLAVLPFQNLTGNPAQEFVSDGLTEEMITQLGALNYEQLRVIARTSAMSYKGTTKSIDQIGRELGVDYLLEGSLRSWGERVRISAQLIAVSNQTHVWAANYDRNTGDILALQNEVAHTIAKEIQVQLAQPRQGRLADTRPVNPAAYEAYLKGRYFWYQRTEEGLQKGIASFNQAIGLDPRYAAAYVGLSDCHALLALRGIVPASEAFPKARAAVMKALEIDPHLGEARASLAHIRLHDWDWDGLDEEFKRALELSPGHAIAYSWYSEYLSSVGRVDESIAVVKTSQQIDPVSPVIATTLPTAWYLARQYDPALEYLLRALELNPNHFLLHFRLGQVYVQKGRFQEAIAEMQKAVNLSERSTEALTGLAQAYAAAGMKNRTEEIVSELNLQAPKHYVSPFNMARVYAALKDHEQAFWWLERSYRERNPDMIELNNDPAFDNVRSDPRFAELLRRIGWRN